MYVNTIPMGKDICNDFREAIMTARQSGKDYKLFGELAETCREDWQLSYLQVKKYYHCKIL